MTLPDILAVLRKRWLSIVAAGLVGLAVAAVVTMLTPREYTTTATVFLAVQGNSVSEQVQGSTYAEKQVQSYADLATTPFVLDRVIAELELAETPATLARDITTRVPSKTVLIDITVRRQDAQLAADIANSASTQLANAVSELSPKNEDGSHSVRATTIAPAAVPQSPSAPTVPRNLVVGLFLGVLGGGAIAVMISLLDTRLHGVTDIERTVDNSVIGSIPREDPKSESAANTVHRSEAYRRLRTNLQFLQVTDGGRALVVTSSIPGEGKTTTAIELAKALSETGRSVLLIDADLRRPNVAKLLHLEGKVGLTTVLIGRADLQDVTQPVGRGTLDVLPSGRIPPNPSELLGAEAMQELLTEAAVRYDHVIIDTPPVLPVTDACVLSSKGADTLIVVGTNEAHRHQLRSTIASMERVDAHVVGLVANKVALSGTSTYEYGYNGNEELDDDSEAEVVEHAPRRSLPAAP